MRKLLLGTTALAAAATLSANVAVADISISGYYEWKYQSTSSDIAANDGTTFANDSEIKFSFTIHGLSGWKRGDKFKILGLPNQYNNGFFQVTQINQQCEGMVWKTQVEGQFRNVSS